LCIFLIISRDFSAIFYSDFNCDQSLKLLHDVIQSADHGGRLLTTGQLESLSNEKTHNISGSHAAIGDQVSRAVRVDPAVLATQHQPSAHCVIMLHCTVVAQADESHGSKAFIHVCLCLCVYVRMIEPITNLSIMSPGYLFSIRSKGQRLRSQGHKLQKKHFR